MASTLTVSRVSSGIGAATLSPKTNAANVVRALVSPKQLNLNSGLKTSQCAGQLR